MSELRKKCPYLANTPPHQRGAPPPKRQRDKYIILRYDRRRDTKEILIPADPRSLKALADFLIRLCVKKR